jgi:hypothetical protein
MSGLFLCTEPDKAFFCSAVFKLGSNPVEATGHLHAISGVGIAVKALEDKHPLIRAEMNGLGGFLACHEWIACSFRECSVL